MARQVRRLGIAAAVTASYVLAGKFGLSLAFVHSNATAVWPPTGIALAALLLLGYRLWPAIFLGAFLVNFTTAGSLATSVGIATGNTLETLAGAWLVNHFAGGRRAFERAPDVFKFALLAGLLSTIISATLGVTSLVLEEFAAPPAWGSIWLTWWLGDLGGALMVTPFLLLWATPPWRWTAPQVLEGGLLLITLTLICELVFGGWLSSDLTHMDQLEVLCLPPLLWAAFRFGPREAATALLLLAWLAVGGTLRGIGPFASPTPNEALGLLQVFLGLTALTTLVLAATVLERRRSQDALQQARREAEQTLRERTAHLAQTVKDLLIAHHELKESHEELKTAHLQLIQAAKLESVGRLAAGVAHEVKNPLAIILQGVDYLSRRLSAGDSQTQQVLRHTTDAIQRADTIVRGLLDFSATRELLMSDESLNAVIERALLLVKHEIDRVGIATVLALAPELPAVPLDGNKLEQVFVNVLMNAVQAMPQGGTLTVRTAVRTLEDVRGEYEAGFRVDDRFKVGETVVVADVEDTGSGIPERVLSKVFDPFFTTKTAGKGTGLGLTVVRKIVELHGGLITVANRPEGGVRVTLVLRAPAGIRS